MLRRTWEYGTRKKATVDDVSQYNANKRGGEVRMVTLTILTDDQREGHMIVGSNPLAPVAGDKVTIEFRKGGPTGGYWWIVEKEEKADASN